MSREHVLQFFAKLAGDSDMQQELAQLGARHGFEFTTEDIRQCLGTPSEHELTEEQLDGVSGGGGPSLLFPGLDRYLKPGGR
jgi:predicted ribosomally synthesized peptide with nif11-like leader